MAEEDIYHSKEKYEAYKERIDTLTLKPEEKKQGNIGEYYCKNPENLKYFKKLVTACEAKDLSYARRINLLHRLKIICYFIEKDLAEVGRDEIDQLMVSVNERYKTPNSRVDIIKDFKVIWKALFPERDERGRIDEKAAPYQLDVVATLFR